MTVRKTIFAGLEITHNRRKRVPAGTEQSPWLGSSYVPDGKELVTYRVDVDLSTLEAMAHKAAESKGQKSQDGPLVVTVTGRKRL